MVRRGVRVGCVQAEMNMELMFGGGLLHHRFHFAGPGAGEVEEGNEDQELLAAAGGFNGQNEHYALFGGLDGGGAFAAVGHHHAGGDAGAQGGEGAAGGDMALALGHMGLDGEQGGRKGQQPQQGAPCPPVV